MKIQKMMMMLFGGLMALSSLTACGGGDDEPTTAPKQPDSQTKVATSVKVDYSATVSQHVLDVATVTVHYVGENGQIVSEQMSSTTWTKSVIIALPVKAGLNIQPTLKGNVADAEYTLSAKGQMSYSWLDQDGKQLQAGLTETTPELEAKFYANGLGQYLGAIAANCQLARSFAKDCSANNATITWGGNTGDDSTQSTGIATDGATDENR